MKKALSLILLLFFSLNSLANTAAIPAERQGKSHGKWIARHNKHKAFLQSKKPVDLLMIGDSITDCWQWGGGRGKNVWNEYYQKRNPYNIGISGDTTQGVLWRLQNGAIDNISPKLAVVMIGTNNHKNTSEEVAEGIKEILKELRKQLPTTKILLLDIFPRGKNPSETKLHLKNAKTNEIIRKYANQKQIFSMNINKIFLQEDGMLNMALMKDPVHPNEAGYKIWAEAMEPFIEGILGPRK
ncbi:MAG: GDSL-type esterase/lipase family protein [Lentisphaerales bacterium]|nr:GDSL-type esterase/lipase family protein [Lentisphaerales bacterium]